LGRVGVEVAIRLANDALVARAEEERWLRQKIVIPIEYR
jgi:hypothetical protein